MESAQPKYIACNAKDIDVEMRGEEGGERERILSEWVKKAEQK